MNLRRRLRRLEEILTPPPKPRLSIVILAEDGRTVVRLTYQDGTEESPQGLTLDDLTSDDLDGTLIIGGVDADACLGRKPGEGAPVAGEG